MNILNIFIRQHLQHFRKLYADLFTPKYIYIIIRAKSTKYSNFYGSKKWLVFTTKYIFKFIKTKFDFDDQNIQENVLNTKY